jgi:hypothetical protein
MVNGHEGSNHARQLSIRQSIFPFKDDKIMSMSKICITVLDLNFDYCYNSLSFKSIGIHNHLDKLHVDFEKGPGTSCGAASSSSSFSSSSVAKATKSKIQQNNYK